MAAAPAPAQPTQAPQVNPTTEVIPDAGVYGAETAAATNAYNNAVAQAAAQRNSTYNQYGLTNTGAVDINNPYGQYQQMLGSQGQQFQADQADAVSRGLGLHGGLGNQQLGVDRNAANTADFGFQQQANAVSQGYNQQMQDALTTEQNANSQAYTDAINTALQNQLAALQAGTYTAPGVGKPGATTTPVKGGGTKAPAPKHPKAGPKPKANHPIHRKGGGGRAVAS